MDSIKISLKNYLLNLIHQETPKEKIQLYDNPNLKDYNILSSIFDDLLKEKSFFSLKSIEEIKWLFDNKENFHRYLYDHDKIMNIDFDNHISLAFLYYLDVLIKEEPNLINYSCSYKYIIKINEFHNLTNEPIVQFVCAKIIIDLINNYKNFDENNEEDYKKYLLQIENENKNIIKKSINIFEMKEEDIYSKSIDFIYIEIFKALIKNNEFNNFEYISNLLDYLEFDLIDNMYYMKNLLIDFFNKKYIDNINKNNSFYENEITELLGNNSQINFYYFLFKYILKDSFYIYQNPFLLNMRKTLIKLLKVQPSELLISEKDKGIKKRFDFIKSFLLDSEYYNKTFPIKTEKKTKTNSTTEQTESRNNDLNIGKEIKIIQNTNSKNERSSKNNIIDFDKQLDKKEYKYKSKSKENETFLKKLKDSYPNSNFGASIKIKKNNIIAVAIDITNKGEFDKLLFYDFGKKEIVKEINEYSFSKSESCFELIARDNSLILICACKNNKKGSGLLIINLEILNCGKKYDKRYINFFEIGNFNVDSICQIIDKDYYNPKEFILDDYLYYLENIKGDYLLVCGHNKQSLKIKIELFIIYFNDYNPTNIKFLRNINFEKNKDFKGFVNRIYLINQLKENGKIIIGSGDELYLFKEPNLELYYNEEENNSFICQRSLSYFDKNSSSISEELFNNYSQNN